MRVQNDTLLFLFLLELLVWKGWYGGCSFILLLIIQSVHSFVTSVGCKQNFMVVELVWCVDSK